MNSFTNSFDKKRGTNLFITDSGLLKLRGERERKEESSPEKSSGKIMEEKIENKESIKEKKYESLYDKILFRPPHQNYYQKFPITPGINFIKKLFSHDKSEKLIQKLKINIPETYWNDTEIYYIYNDFKNYNALKMIRNQRDFNLFHTIKNVEKDYYKREFQPNAMVDPFMIVRSKETDYENTVKVEKYEKAQENMGKEIGEGIIQRYIRSKGRNRELEAESKKKQPSIEHRNVKVRSEKERESEIEFSPRKSRDGSSEIDFHPQNKENQNEGNNNSSIMSINNIFPNNTGMINNFSNFNEVNQNYVLNLNKGLSQRKSKLALKNITEERKKVFTKPTVIRLVYKTSFNSSKNPNLAYYLINKEYVEPLIRSTTKEIPMEKYSAFCSMQTLSKETFDIYIMAGEAVKPYEFYANEIVQYVKKLYKLLLKTIVIDFIKDERGIIYFLGVKSFTPVREPEDIRPECNLTDLTEEKNIKKLYKTWTCRLCLLAYPKAKITKVVTFKLLVNLKENLEKRGKSIFNHINNNGFNESSSCRVCDLCYKLLITEQELMEIQKTIAICNNIPVQSEEQLSIKKKTPENMIKVAHKHPKVNQWRVLFYFIRFYMIDLKKINFDDKVNFKLYIKLFDQKYGIPIFNDIDKFKSQDEVEINLSKIFYFFTAENSNLKQILKNEEVDFRIVVNDDYYNPLAQCLTTCLSFYENETATKTARVKNTLNFFSSSLKYFKCQVYVGLNNDGEVLAESIPLYNFKISNSIYLSDSDYFSYHPLPDDWHELFIPPDSTMEDFEDYKLDKLIDDIIDNLEFGKKKKQDKEKTEKGDEIYDPYETLVQIQGKKRLISKIKSIPVIQDMRYVDKNKLNTKTRPQTSLLASKFNNDQKSNKKEKAVEEDASIDKHPSQLQSLLNSKSSKNLNPNFKVNNRLAKDLEMPVEKKLSDDMINNLLGKIDQHINDNFND